MVDLGLSINSIAGIFKKSNWVDIYESEFNRRSSNLEKVKDAFPEGVFAKKIKPQLELLFSEELSKKPFIIDIRKSVQKWMLMGEFKSQSCLRILHRLPEEMAMSEKILSKYADIPIGPVDSETLAKMTPAQIGRWQEGNRALYCYCNSVINSLGIYVSEIFFATEAMCRVTCMGSCLDFAVKCNSQNIPIQHKDIFNTLIKLSGKNRTSITCRLCPLKKDCTNSAYFSIAEIYELFYHLRSVKDYRLEFYDDVKLQKFLINNYLNKSILSIYILDKIIDKMFSNYLKSPLTVEEENKIFSDILKKS